MSGGDRLGYKRIRAIGDNHVEAVARGGAVGTQSMDLRGWLLEWLPKLGQLSGSRQEGQELGALLNVSPLLGDEVLERPLKEAVSPAILHLAAHGFFLQSASDSRQATSPARVSDRKPRRTVQENPMLRSGIVLSGAKTWAESGPDALPANAEDGILNARDVTAMDLRGTQLVVLSACETALGAPNSGEGVMGLRRGFIVAGARTVVMTLWKIPDAESQELMLSFYERILAGETCADALHRTLLEQADTAPEKWAGFVLHGDPAGISLASQ